MTKQAVIINPAITDHDRSVGYVPKFLSITKKRAAFLYALVCVSYYKVDEAKKQLSFAEALELLAPHIKNANESLFIGAKLYEIYALLSEVRDFIAFRKHMPIYMVADGDNSIEAMARRMAVNVKDDYTELEEVKEAVV